MSESLTMITEIAKNVRSSTLCVKIKNASSSAYQHEVYGNSIIVERHFSRSGSSGFKLKNSSGRLVSTKKGDLEEICDYFALQIDNPMNVLTQDMARQFLSNSTPSEKYRFFMKGTQLEHLDGDYLQIEQNLETIDLDLERKREDVKVLNDEMKRAKQLLLLSEKHDTLREKIRQLGYQMAWAQVENEERKLEICLQNLIDLEQEVVIAKTKEDEASDAFDKTNQDVDNFKTAVDELNEELIPIEGEKERVKQEHDTFKSEALGVQVCPLHKISLCC